MDKYSLIRKCLVVGIILLLIGIIGVQSINAINSITENIIDVTCNLNIILDNGTLSGYVTDCQKNPIEGARVRVYFHDTYRENYTDSTGYYHVTDIPICFCMKNATCSKEGYYSEWVLLSISENTTYDFTLLPYNCTKLVITVLGPMMRIKNIGNATAYNVSWTITVHGGLILLGRDSWGDVREPLEPGQEITVGRKSILLGFGLITFIGKVWADNAPMVSASVTGRLLLIFFFLE